jgi:GT2 family glycosyltransferase
MKVLFYIEPLTELEKPTWKDSWVNFVAQAMASLRESRSSISFCCIVGDGLEEIAKNKLKSCEIYSINHFELVPEYGSNALNIATNWYRGTVSVEIYEKMARLVRKRISPFVPDICITFSPASFIQLAFPGLPILYFEHGLFSRKPFPVTAYLDPNGMYQNSYLYINGKKISDFVPEKSDKQIVNAVRDSYLSHISNINPFRKILTKKLKGYRAVVLVALQFSQFYAYDAHAFFPDQYDLLSQTLASLPEDIAVIAVEHPEYPILSRDTLNYLSGRFSNLVWVEEFRSYPSASQYLMEFSDVVVTVSSSVGFQSLLWKKKLVILGDSHLNLIADAHDFREFNTLLARAWPEYKEHLLAWNLTRYTMPFDFLFRKGVIMEKIDKAIECASKGTYDDFFSKPYAEPEEIINYYSRDGEISNLNQTLMQRDESIAKLNQTLMQHDESIAKLNQTLMQRDESIAKLNQTLMQRDESIANLNQALMQHNDSIANLNQALMQHDESIAKLNQTLMQRDESIAKLNQTLMQRDGKIADLEDEVVRRGVWGSSLNLQLIEAQKNIHRILQSNSWKITRALREIRRWIDSPREQLSRYKKFSLKLVVKIYQLLPLSGKNKITIKYFLSKHFREILILAGVSPVGDRGNDSPRKKLTIAQTECLIEDDLNKNLSSIDIKTNSKPLISIIIPVYGKIHYTLQCLSSISLNLPEVPFEVLVIDDCSPGESWRVLSGIPGIRFFRNKTNQGFIRTCNFGASEARGEYFHFLNNDTRVTSGWLDELHQTFTRFPGTGLVGSKLIYPDGRLQEAGCIVWRDGSAWNFGKFQNPELPVYSYSREVDYCSAASILVPRHLFEELGGFDEKYCPDRYEDSDLALKVRDKGYRVIYQSMSKVIHYEGISVGTDDDASENVKTYREQNSKIFFERWSKRLSRHQDNGVDIAGAKDRCAIYRALYLDLCTPTPDQDSGSIDAYNHMLLLREMGFQVTFIPTDNFLYMPEYTSDLQRMGIEALYSPYVNSVEDHLREFGDRYDLIFVSRPNTLGLHIENIKKYCHRAKILFHTVDLHFLRMEREGRLINSSKLSQAATAMKDLELSLIANVDVATVVSAEEVTLLSDLAPNAKVRLLPYSRFIRGTQKTFSERSDIVFVGGFQHTPNIDAVVYFVKEIMPILRTQLPGVCFYVVGSKPPPEIFELETADVIIKGFVKDLGPLFDDMRLSVAPLRFGAGIKGKIGSAMAMGLPVVATSMAAEGMLLSHMKNIWIADGAVEFSNAISTLYQSENLWNQLSRSGLSYASNSWGAETAFNTLARVLEEMNIQVERKSREITLYESYTLFQKQNKFDCAENQGDSNYTTRIQQELDIYKGQVNVHELPEIFHYWSNKHLVPILKDAEIGTIEDFFSSNLINSVRRTGSSQAHLLSIGAGNCDLEVSIAKKLVDMGYSNFVLECLEINPAMIARGKQSAADRGVSDKMHFTEADFNVWKACKEYHGVIANQSLHHVMELEHLFRQIKGSLHDRGSFVISDMIGRNGHQRWPETLNLVNKYWAELTIDKKYNVLLKRFEKEYENWDCSNEGFEGVRAQDILPLLVKEFKCEKFVGFGGVVDIFIDRCFGHNFNPNSIEDLAFIDRLHAEDEIGLQSGALKPTQMRAVFVKRLSTTPFYSRGISPQMAIRDA